MNEKERALKAHLAKRGKIEIIGSAPVQTREQLSEYYTPGVAFVSLEVSKDKNKAYDYTFKGRNAAIVSDGTRVLGLGDIGAEAAMPVMEGKAMLLKKLGGVDAIPICVGTKEEHKIVECIKAIAPTFGAINIEDIETPKCLNIVEVLKKEIDIPVFHDDRQGVAVVTLAALINALKLAKKRINKAKIVINGAGAAGIGIAELLSYAGARNLYVLDTRGCIYKGRKENMNQWKERIAELVAKDSKHGDIADIASAADVLIGVSEKGAFSQEMIKSMANDPIVFALANPYPEIEYEDAIDAGAFIAATGRSDRPNQVNNLLAFPGIMRGLIESKSKRVDELMLLRAAKIIARFCSKGLSREHIVPDPMEKKTILKLAAKIAASVAETANELHLSKTNGDPKKVEMDVADSIRRYLKIERFIAEH